MGGGGPSATVESLFPGDRGRSHLRQADSKEYEFKPSLRPLEPYKASHEAKYGMRHVTEAEYKVEARQLHGGAPLQRPELRHGYDMSRRSGYDIPDPPVRASLPPTPRRYYAARVLVEAHARRSSRARPHALHGPAARPNSGALARDEACRVGRQGLRLDRRRQDGPGCAILYLERADT